MYFCPELRLASSMAFRVSLVNLQKLTLWACEDPASMRMLAPAQNTRSLPDRHPTTMPSAGPTRSRCTAGARPPLLGGRKTQSGCLPVVAVCKCLDELTKRGVAANEL